MYIDLHIHTQFSDGTWNPKELKDELKKENITYFSVTDHNTLEGIPFFKEEFKNTPFIFIPGVEIHSQCKGTWFHILGYHIQPENKNLQQVLLQAQQSLEDLNDEIIQGLIQEGHPFSFEEYQNWHHEPSRGGSRFISYLVDKNYARNYSEIFAKCEHKGIERISPAFVHASVVIRALQEAGGKAIMAHPGYLTSSLPLIEENLKSFLEMGINGIECYHPRHTKEVTAFCLDFCQKNNLLITGGSDCHGSYTQTRPLNSQKLTSEKIRASEILKPSSLL